MNLTFRLRNWQRVLSCLLCLLAVFGPLTQAQVPGPLRVSDLYATDTVTEAVTLSDGRSAVYCRTRAEASTRTLRQSLWRVDDSGPPRPLESGEPDGFSPRVSPDGRWIAFLSTRNFEDGTPAVMPVPPYSDSAADIWLMPVGGGKAVPLGGKNKPYGRVITDRFYGRFAFSPDAKRIAFVADEGVDPRSDSERRNRVQVVREDQGEGYEGYGPMHVWVADLSPAPSDVAADRITRITHDEFWYGDPQWAPDGSFLVVHANRTADRESVRFTNVNRNFDLWKITLSDHRMEQLTSGPGPEFSPRISPDGTRLACLSSPRRGPHMDVFNLMIVGLSGDAIGSRVVFDHHGPGAEVPPSLPPTHPLPEHCWRDANHLVYNAFRGVKPESQCLNVDSGPGVVVDPGARPPFRSPLLPVDNPTLNSRLRARDEIIRWKTFDGLEIEGVLTTPPDSLAQKPHKLLVIPHGGPHSRSSLGSNFEVQIFAANGFAVFQPNFRGSSGYGLGFLDADRLDYGGGDMRDILSGIDALIEKGVVDRNRQFVFGASYGGFMAAWLVGHTTQFRAAVALNAVTDLNAMWHLSDVQSWTEWGMGGLPWEVSKRMRDHSPLTHVARVRTPTLILHSLNDRRCPVAMGHMFHQALKRCGVETQMVLYPEEGHGLKQLPHREDLLMRTLEWFTQHDVPASNSRTSPREP